MKQLTLCILLSIVIASCSNNRSGNIKLRDYQLDINEAGTIIYDSNRVVKLIPYGEIPALDSIIDSDNL